MPGASDADPAQDGAAAAETGRSVSVRAGVVCGGPLTAGCSSRYVGGRRHGREGAVPYNRSDRSIYMGLGAAGTPGQRSRDADLTEICANLSDGRAPGEPIHTVTGSSAVGYHEGWNVMLMTHILPA